MSGCAPLFAESAHPADSIGTRQLLWGRLWQQSNISVRAFSVTRNSSLHHSLAASLSSCRLPCQLANILSPRC